jgi:hypothetical protein
MEKLDSMFCTDCVFIKSEDAVAVDIRAPVPITTIIPVTIAFFKNDLDL